MKQVYLKKLLEDPGIIWMDVVWDYSKKEWDKKIKSCIGSNSLYCYKVIEKYNDWLKRNEKTNIFIRKHKGG